MKKTPRLRALILPPLDLAADTADPFEAALEPGGALHDLGPDMVLCAGLLVDGSKDSADHASRLLQRLLNGLDRAAGRLFVAPGPGDADRERGGPLLALADTLPADAVFGHPATGALVVAQFEHFARLQANFAASDALTPAAPYALRFSRLAHLNIAVLALNSAWLENGERLVAAAQVAPRAESFCGADLRIVLAFDPPAAWRATERAALAPILEAAHLVLSADSSPRWLEVWRKHLFLRPLDGSKGQRLDFDTPLPMASKTARGQVLPPDLQAYLSHAERRWGQVDMVGLARGGQPMAAQPVASIYIPLRTTAPRSQTLPGMRLEQGDPEGVLEAEADDRADLVQQALKRLGVVDDPRAVRHALARIAAFEPSEAELGSVLGSWELEQAIAAHDHLLIEGNPGSGKTTTLRAVAAALVQAHLGDPQAAEQMGLRPPWRLPVMVTFRRFWSWLADHENAEPTADLLVDWLVDRVAQHGGATEWLRAALEAGTIALLFDGVDELPGDLRREQALLAVEACAARFHRCRWIITSRPSGLDAFATKALGGVPDLASFKVAPLQRDQIAEFLRRWYGQLEPGEEGEGRARTLLDTIRQRGWLDNPHSLAATPITLMVLALVGQRGPLPQLRAELYYDCVRVLAEQWEWQKIEVRDWLMGDLNINAKFKVLQAIARAAMNTGEERVDTGALLEAVHAALPKSHRPEDPRECQRFVDHLAERSGLLHKAGRHWRFRHRTFLEYLAARQICDAEPDAPGLLATHLDNGAWHEVTLLACGHLAVDHGSKALAMLKALFDGAQQYQADVGTRADCHGRVSAAVLDLRAYEVSGLSDTVDDFKATWAELLEHPEGPGTLTSRLAIGDALGQFGDPRIGWGSEQFLPVPAGPYCAGTVSADPLTYDYGPERGGLHQFEDETQPAFEVPAFRVARYPVTVGQFLAFWQADDRGDPRWWGDGDPSDFPGVVAEHLAGCGRNEPATAMTWFEARAFCAWASHHRRPADGWRYALPNERQWEKAARGGPALASGPNPNQRRVFPWGNEPPDEARANCAGLEIDRRTPVGLFALGRGASGALDLAGNVWEWCLDVSTAPWLDESEARDARVLRGGAFVDVPLYLRVAIRSAGLPLRRNVSFGFRCVCVPAEDP